jgi:hypothetical protein
MHFDRALSLLRLAGPLALLALPGCATATAMHIEPNAKYVRIAPERPVGCRELGEVMGSYESEDQLQAVNGAQWQLRNRASVLGGDYVQVFQNYASRSWTGYAPGAHEVTLSGIAFRCSAPPSPAPVTAAPAAPEAPATRTAL